MLPFFCAGMPASSPEVTWDYLYNDQVLIFQIHYETTQLTRYEIPKNYNMPKLSLLGLPTIKEGYIWAISEISPIDIRCAPNADTFKTQDLLSKCVCSRFLMLVNITFRLVVCIFLFCIALCTLWKRRFINAGYVMLHYRTFSILIFQRYASCKQSVKAKTPLEDLKQRGKACL